MFYRAHARFQTDVGTESMTKQSHKDECDINKILKQYQKTGMITHISSNQPMYGDMPSDMDYQSALHIMMDAEAAFASIPAKVRDQFNNDPAKWLAALQDPEQRDKMTEWGFFEKPPKQDPFPASSPPATPAAATPAPPAGGSTGA